MPRPVHEFNHDIEMILVTNPRIRIAGASGLRLIWNMKGLRRIIPDGVFDNAMTLLEDYQSRIRAFDRVPKSVGLIYFEQCVEIPNDHTQ